MTAPLCYISRYSERLTTDFLYRYVFIFCYGSFDISLSPFFFPILALTLLSFFLPPDSGERITLVITNLLAMTVFMLIVAEIMPATSEVVPLISIYYTGIMFEVT